MTTWPWALTSSVTLGVGVPEHIAIAGFHGHDVGQAMTPRLASVVTPARRLAKPPLLALLARIRGEALEQKVVDLGYRIEAGKTL